MIKGRAEIRFGTGDIRTTCMMEETENDRKGVYILENQEQHEIGEHVPVNENFTVKGKDIMITFSKVESVDVVIQDLQDIKEMMLNGKRNEDMEVNTSSKDFW